MRKQSIPGPSSVRPGIEARNKSKINLGARPRIAMMKVSLLILLGLLWLSAVKSHSESSSHTNNWAVLVSYQCNQVH